MFFFKPKILQKESFSYDNKKHYLTLDTNGVVLLNDEDITEKLPKELSGLKTIRVDIEVHLSISTERPNIQPDFLHAKESATPLIESKDISEKKRIYLNNIEVTDIFFNHHLAVDADPYLNTNINSFCS